MRTNSFFGNPGQQSRLRRGWRLPASCDGEQAKRSDRRELQEYFADVATTFVNLEATLDCDSLTPRELNGLGQIVAAPSASLAYLEAIRSRAVGIANNHSYDFGDAGVWRTRDAIAQSGMIPLGAGCSLSEGPEVFVWEGPAATARGVLGRGESCTRIG